MSAVCSALASFLNSGCYLPHGLLGVARQRFGRLVSESVRSDSAPSVKPPCRKLVNVSSSRRPAARARAGRSDDASQEVLEVFRFGDGFVLVLSRLWKKYNLPACNSMRPIGIPALVSACAARLTSLFQELPGSWLQAPPRSDFDEGVGGSSSDARLISPELMSINLRFDLDSSSRQRSHFKIFAAVPRESFFHREFASWPYALTKGGACLRLGQINITNLPDCAAHMLPIRQNGRERCTLRCSEVSPSAPRLVLSSLSGTGESSHCRWLA
jgi:hypothetical protein